MFGLLAIRATGVYFLMITLALGQCVWGLAYRWNSLTGGDNGINLRERPKFGIDLANEVTFFYVVFGFFAVSLLLMYTLVRSPFGRSLAGIRERELRMKILGYNTWLHKYIAFIIAGGFGGLSGVLWAHTAGIVSPVNVELPTSVDALLMAVLGGSGTLVGGVIGSCIVFGLREYLSTHGAVVAVRAGRGLRADDPVSADRPDGHSGAHPPAARADGQCEDGEQEIGTRGLLTRRDVDNKGVGHDKHLATTAQPAAARQLRCTRHCRRVAEELRIGYVAPTTGIFAQVGKDMVDGFQMYLDEVKNDFGGGATVKFIVEDEQAKPDTAVTKAKKLILQDKVHMLVGGLLASSGYALAPVAPPRRRSTSCRSPRPTT